MTQLLLGAVFGELGISQYLDAFLEQGFDTWETILDITESDLDALGVKLGHRRKLQRRIANSRGIAPDASLVSPTQSSAEDLKLQQQDAVKPEPAAVDAREPAAVVVTKRKYRRHPKPDENAPERPPSAYVLFSNKMREELKGRNLSFTEIAKLVGENWQNLSAAEKEPFESQAQAIKDKYLSDLASYKKTGEYRKYMTYLQEFKTKHASPSQDKDASKRLRLSEPSVHGRGSPGATPTRTSRSGSGPDSRKGSEPPTSRQRVDSSVSAGESQFAVSLGPPGMASPDEPVLSPVISESDRHSADLSPVMKPEPREHQPMLAAAPRHPSQGEDQSRDRMDVHRHLPSLSDVFDGQGLPGGMRPSIEPSGGYRFPGGHLNQEPNRQGGGDSRPPPMTNGHPYPSTSQHPPFGPPRPAVDGPLPIHALLASKPEFHAHQQPQPPQHIHPYHHDQKPRLAPPNGGRSPNSLPMINPAGSYHPTPPPLSHHHHNNNHPSPPPSAVNGHHPHPQHQHQHHHMNQQPQQQQQPFRPQQPQHQSHQQQQQQRSPQPPQQTSGPPPPQGILPSPARPGGGQAPGQGGKNLDGMSALLRAGEIVDRRQQ